MKIGNTGNVVFKSKNKKEKKRKKWLLACRSSASQMSNIYYNIVRPYQLPNAIRGKLVRPNRK